jgi:cobalt-zinc-cadmium efflux system protein
VNADRRFLRIALLLLLAFMVAEVVVAIFSGSLALLSDAGHMLSDVGAIGASLWAISLAARPAKGAWTYGWKRAEILSAAGNGITLLVVSGIVAFEAIRRLIHPPQVDGGPVLVVAMIGVAVNIVAAWVLAKANRSSLNVEGAFKHIITDLYGFIGTVLAAIVILTTGFTRADAIASLIVVGLMVHAAWRLLRDSGPAARPSSNRTPHEVPVRLGRPAGWTAGGRRGLPAAAIGKTIYCSSEPLARASPRCCGR